LKLFNFLLPICLNLFSCLQADVNDSIKKIYAHLTLHDARSATEEAYYGLTQFPDSQELNELNIKSLSLLHREKELIHFTHNYLEKFPVKKKDRQILEDLSWGVIENASLSNAPLVRIYALLAAFFSNDAKGIQLIQKSLLDSNFFLRGAAIKVSCQLNDLKLQTQMIRLINEEPNFRVRLEAIKAVGLMKANLAKNDLERIIADEQMEHEERAVAIESLVNLLDVAKRDEIQALTKSQRVGFRLLACEIVLVQEMKDDIDLIIPLLKDVRREVRRSALETLGFLQITEFKGVKVNELVAPLLKDIDSTVAMTTAFVILLNDKESGQKALKPFFESTTPEERLIASAVLVKAGKHAMPLMLNVFEETKDPFVKMNLSIGLILQRENTESACNALYLGLRTQKEPLIFVNVGEFKYLTKSKPQATELIPNEKESVNQLVRLEILNMLSIMKYKNIEAAIKEFLQERSWGISLMASALLLTEGDESAIEHVQNLLKDPSEKVRVQAALILSMWSQGDEALPVLQEAYPCADREMKEKILEGIGRIGSFSSVPFLLDCLKEPFQLLRVIAASSLLQILYH